MVLKQKTISKVEEIFSKTGYNFKILWETAKLFTSGESLGKSINGERKRRKDGITEWFYNIDKGIHAELFTTN